MEDFIRLLAKQKSLSGGTSLISMYIPPNGRVSLSKQKLTNEMGLVSNIKSKVVQKHKNRSKISIIATKPAKRTKNFMPWVITTIWHHTKYL